MHWLCVTKFRTKIYRLGVHLLILMIVSCNNAKLQGEYFQVAQVHNQASKKLPAKPLPSHYLLLQYSPVEKKLPLSEKNKITNLLLTMADKSQYKVIVIVTSPNEKQSKSKNAVGVNQVLSRAQEIKDLLKREGIPFVLIIDTKLPEDRIYLEFKQKNGV